jgi:hypothetical protein
MILFEDNTYVFIVRIWFERREIEGAAEKWRGVIEHVPTGQRCYMDELDTISNFITTHLDARNANLCESGKNGHA